MENQNKIIEKTNEIFDEWLKETQRLRERGVIPDYFGYPGGGVFSILHEDYFPVCNSHDLSCNAVKTLNN
jgi:hypothetical protein